MYYDSVLRSRTIIFAAMLLIGSSVVAFASAPSSGIDTPTGTTSLPLSVQGVKGCEFDANGASAPNVNCFGNMGIGIGTASPQAKLDVMDPTNTSTSQLRLGYQDGVYDFGLGRNPTTGALTIQGTQTGADNIVLAPTNGNVGIGTANPQATLDVNGTTNIGPSTGGPSSSTVLTVNGDLTVLGTANIGNSCSPLGTIAQDGTGRLLSCQSTTSNGQTSYTWQSALGGGCSSAQVKQALAQCTNVSAAQSTLNVGSLQANQIAYYDWMGPMCAPYGNQGGGQEMQCLNGQVIPITCNVFSTCTAPPSTAGY